MATQIEEPTFALAPEQVRFYRDQGYLLVRGVYDESELAEMRDEADAMIGRARLASQNPTFLWGGKWLDDASRQKLDINGVHDPQFHSAAFSKAMLSPRLLDAAAELIGPNIQLHHSKLIVKPPSNGAPFPMHQDYPYFPHKRHSMIAASVHMDHANAENGCLRVVPASHKLGPLPTEGDGLYLSPDEYPVEEAQICEANAGDVLFFSYLTIHGSGHNLSDRPRRNVLFQLRDPEDEPAADVHKSKGQGMMLRGYNPVYLSSAL